MSRNHKKGNPFAHTSAEAVPLIIFQHSNEDDFYSRGRPRWEQVFDPMVSDISGSNYVGAFPSLEHGKNYIINIDSLSRIISLIGEEYKKNQKQFEQLAEQIEYCTNYIRSLALKQPERKIETKLPPIMVSLIEKAKQNDDIIKILYEITDEGYAVFNLLLENVDAESYRMSSELEFELSAKFKDVDITVNPVDINDVEIIEKYQFYTKT